MEFKPIGITVYISDTLTLADSDSDSEPKNIKFNRELAGIYIKELIELAQSNETETNF